MFTTDEYRKMGQYFVSEKNICEHAIVCDKTVAECKEDVLLEAAAIQDA